MAISKYAHTFSVLNQTLSHYSPQLYSAIGIFNDPNKATDNIVFKVRDLTIFHQCIIKANTDLKLAT